MDDYGLLVAIGFSDTTAILFSIILIWVVTSRIICKFCETKMKCPCCGEDIGKWRDRQILEFCTEERSLTDISKHINIAVTNVIPKVKKLENDGKMFVKKQGRGKKALILINKRSSSYQRGTDAIKRLRGRY